MPDNVERLGLDRLRREPAAEIGNGVDEIDIGPTTQIGWRCACIAMLQTKAGQRLQGAHHVMGIVLGQGGDRIVCARRSIQPPPEPLLEDGVEGGLGVGRVQDARTRIDVGFDRIAADDRLAEGVNRGGGQFIELVSGR